MFSHLREFAKRVKLSGTAEELESFAYLRAVLEGYGYITKLIQHDAYISFASSGHSEHRTRESSLHHSFLLTFFAETWSYWSGL